MSHILNFASELHNTLKLQTERIEKLENIISEHTKTIADLQSRLDQTIEETIPKLINGKVQYYIDEAMSSAVDAYFDNVGKEKIKEEIDNKALDSLNDAITEQVEEFCNNLEFTVSVR